MIERKSFRDNLQFGWDSTSLTALMECPRKYQYSLVQGFAPRSVSVHLTFGIHYHKGLERYDYHRVSGFSHDDAVHMVVKEILVATKDWVSDDSYKNRYTLLRSLVWYMDEFPTEKDPLKTVVLANGKPAVELSFRFELPNLRTPWGDPYLYAGHLDRLGEMDGEYWVGDRKTTKSSIAYNFFEKFRPNNQMTGYTVGGRITLAKQPKGVIIDAAQVAVGFTKFQRGVTLRTEGEIEEWFEVITYHIKMAENYAKSDFWPMNYSACDNYGGCPFRPICARSPDQRQQWLKADYAERIWDPLVSRGDI